MALSDTFVKKVRPIKESGEKYFVEEGMYFLVTLLGKYGGLAIGILASAKRWPSACTDNDLSQSPHQTQRRQRPVSRWH